MYAGSINNVLNLYLGGMAIQGTESISLESFVEFPAYTYDPENCWVNVRLRAPEIRDETQLRPPVDLVAVIDRSCSMKGVKFEFVKKSLYFLVSKLNSRDRLSLVVFDQKEKTIFPLTHVAPLVRDWLNVKIENLCIGKGTNICDGLISGIKILLEHRNSAAVASVLLFSDGFATCGTTNRVDIVNAMKNPYNQWAPALLMQRKPQTYTVYTFGFGTHHDTSMLDAISTAGNGVFYRTSSSPKDISNNFANCIGGLLSTFAQDITINIKSINNAVFSEGEELELSMGHTFALMEITDIQCGEQRDILFNLALPQLQVTDGTSTRYAEVDIFYTNSLFGKRDSIGANIVISRVRNLESPRQSNHEVDIQKNRWRAINAMRTSKKKAQEGDYEGARGVLKECKSYVTKSKSSESAQSIWIFADIDGILDGMKDRDSFISSGQSLLTSSLHSHTRQRSTTYNTGGYMTRSRCESLNDSARFIISGNSTS